MYKILVLKIINKTIFIVLISAMPVLTVHAHDLPIPYAFTHKVPVYDEDLALKRPEQEEDLEKVFNLAIEGDPEASILLWRLYTSHLIPQSERKYFTGFHILDKAVSKHPDNAKLNLILGNIYKGDFGIDRDPVKALAYYEKAAENGDVEGYASIALMYVYGRSGLPQDTDKAFEYFKKAAQRGDVESIMIVDNWEGYLKMYVKGEGPN